MTLGGKTILMADSQKPMRQAIRSSIRGMKNGGGVDFLEAFDGASALAELLGRDKPVDVALIDWEMAPMDGAVFLQMLRNDPGYRLHQTTPVIITTGQASPKAMKEALSLGASVLMQKPIAPAELVARILGIWKDKAPFVLVEDGLAKGKPFIGPLTKWSAEHFVRPAQTEKRNILRL